MQRRRWRWCYRFILLNFQQCIVVISNCLFMLALADLAFAAILIVLH